MFLSGTEIIKAIESDKITISHFDKENIKGASYTFTLDTKYKILKANKILDSREDPEFEEFTIGNRGFELKPGSFAIFYTKEKVNLNNKFTCILSTRPTIAQMGLNVTQSSFFCEPNTNNQFALEISNNGPVTVIIYPGTKAVCGVFSRLAN
jgi:deoxycytidine triphosphate deaminase